MFVIEDGRLTACRENPAGRLCIPDTVTTIGSHAFKNNTSLTEAVFPAAVETIGDSAFEGCSSLASLFFHDGIKRLGNGCFRNCSSLRAVHLPDTVASIHPCAFQSCAQLSDVRLSKGLRRNIESHTFAGCTSIKSITIPQGIQQIKSGAFSGCTALRDVFFENVDIQIENGAFSGCPQLSAETSAFVQQHITDKSVTDIKSRASGAVGRLSNFTERHFVFDGIACRSVEGVLQSFKCPDPERQAEICALSGGWAKHAGSQYEWKTNQLLYWKGQAFQRRSMAYQHLLDRLYLAVYEQDESFRSDLAAIRGKRIDHRMGLSNPQETVLTRHEFVFRLQRLSEGKLQHD